MLKKILELLAPLLSPKPAPWVQVSVLVGLMYVALGALRLGFLTNFLSHSVISGFTTGAAIVIGISQVRGRMSFKGSIFALASAVSFPLRNGQQQQACRCSYLQNSASSSSKQSQHTQLGQ